MKEVISRDAALAALKEYNPELGTAEEAVKAIQAATEATLIIDPDLKPMEGDLESLKV